MVTTGSRRADPWAELAFAHPLRRYQRDALTAFEQVRDEHGTRAYLVLPPGAGKTVTGLEAARRLGRPTLVLAPNVAVQPQWLAEWRRFWPGDDHPLPGSADRALTSPLTVLTYQSIAVLARDPELTADGPDASVRPASPSIRGATPTASGWSASTPACSCCRPTASSRRASVTATRRCRPAPRRTPSWPRR